MWGQHQGRPTRVQTNKSRKRVSLVVVADHRNKTKSKPPKSKIQNLKSKLQDPNPQNQNSKIQTPKTQTPRSKIKTPRSKPPKSKLQDPNPKMKTPRSKPPKSKLQDPNQNQNSKIQTPKTKPPNKTKTYINLWFITGPPKKLTNIFLANHQHNEQNIKMEITKKNLGIDFFP